ncbi:MAG: dual specificity protein phosphatase family protein [bacterium]|nr:dual specificity protein phosphatase family protein [bacterium]
MIHLRFTSREGAEDTRPDKYTAVVSIQDPGSADVRLQAGWFNILHVRCNDIDMCKPINARLRTSILASYKPMSPEQAADVVRFVRRMIHEGCGGFLVHCEAGLNRSPAVAKWIAEELGLPPLGPATRTHNRHVYKLLKEASCKG